MHTINYLWRKNTIPKLLNNKLNWTHSKTNMEIQIKTQELNKPKI